jgi:hypothetical protein
MATQISEVEVGAINAADYQRPVDMARARKIAKKFDERKIGLLTVSLRDGQYWIVDGNHRLSALRMIGAEKARCQILRLGCALDQSEQGDSLDEIEGATFEPEGFKELIEKYSFCNRGGPKAFEKVAKEITGAVFSLSFKYEGDDEFFAARAIDRTVFRGGYWECTAGFDLSKPFLRALDKLKGERLILAVDWSKDHQALTKEMAVAMRGGG